MKMEKDLERLAELGEKDLNEKMDRYIQGVYIRSLSEAAGEQQNLFELAYGINLGIYLERRDEFVRCGLDPSRYDNQIRVTLRELNIEVEPFDRCLVFKKEKEKKVR
ncbi:hypothetical protein HZC30_04405 [Candidatus Woesearchaeota archaeon]|nr:hypothetical protein [Candidatus Woesearchaeota archaeon]